MSSRMPDQDNIQERLKPVLEESQRLREENAHLCAMLTDTRGYAIGMADRGDYREIAYGTSAVPEEQAHYWNGRSILGLFDRANARNSARSFKRDFITWVF
jgi:hypothetical protein